MTCWFCSQILNSFTQRINRHHIKPLRFLKPNPELYTEIHHHTNLVLVHVECHERFNKVYDKGWDWKQFQRQMQRINWGKGVFLKILIYLAISALVLVVTGAIALLVTDRPIEC